MIDQRRIILVFGATGRQGGAVVHALLEDGWRVRAFVRDPSVTKAEALAMSGVELVQGSLADTEAIRVAMQGAYGVFSVLPADLTAESEVQAGMTIADLSVEESIAHLIYSSGASVGADPTGVPRFDAKPRIEAYVRTLPIVATIVRPSIFMEMLARSGSGLDQGRLVSLVRPDQLMQLVAVRDIGRFVAAMFADPRQFGGNTVKIAGDTISGRDLAALFSHKLRRTITYSQLPDAVLDANPDLKQMTASLDHGPLSDHVDLAAMRRIVPDLLSVADWLAFEGGPLLAETARRDGVVVPDRS